MSIFFRQSEAKRTTKSRKETRQEIVIPDDSSFSIVSIFATGQKKKEEKNRKSRKMRTNHLTVKSVSDTLLL
jgi:hypothetical protein